MEIWVHRGRRFEYVSMYSVPDESWHHELVELHLPPQGRAAVLLVAVPDAGGDGPFVPASPEEVEFSVSGECAIPWPILARFLETVHRRGDVPTPS